MEHLPGRSSAAPSANAYLQRENWGNFESNVVFLRKTALLDQPRTILEIGCGQGRLAKSLQDAGHEVIALDMDPRNLEACPPDVKTVLADGGALPFPDGSFDMVLSFDVIEHIPDTDRHLAEVSRVLKPDGYYLFQTPNKWTNIPFEMVRWSRSQGIRHMFDFLKPPQHCALHSYGQLRRRLKKNAFDFEFYDISVVNEYFIGKVRAHLGGAGVLLLRVLNPDRLPLALRTNFYVQARKGHITRA